MYEIHDGVGVAGQFILTVITEGTAEVASVMVVVVSGGFGGSGRRLGQSGTLGDLILLQAATLIFFPATAVAGIGAARLDHRGSSFYPQKKGAAMYSTTLAVLN